LENKTRQLMFLIVKPSPFQTHEHFAWKYQTNIKTSLGRHLIATTQMIIHQRIHQLFVDCTITTPDEKNSNNQLESAMKLNTM
jgi:hypothetical protein